MSGRSSETNDVRGRIDEPGPGPRPEPDPDPDDRNPERAAPAALPREGPRALAAWGRPSRGRASYVAGERTTPALAFPRAAGTLRRQHRGSEGARPSGDGR